MHGFCGMNKSELYWKSPAYCITQSILKGIFPSQPKKVEGNQRTPAASGNPIEFVTEDSIMLCVLPSLDFIKYSDEICLDPNISTLCSWDEWDAKARSGRGHGRRWAWL